MVTPVSYTHLDVYKRQVHKVFENGKLLLLAAGNNKLPLLRDNGKIVVLPFTELFIVGRRVCKEMCIRDRSCDRQLSMMLMDS